MPDLLVQAAGFLGIVTFLPARRSMAQARSATPGHRGRHFGRAWLSVVIGLALAGM